MKALVAFVADNVRGLLLLSGVCWVYIGIAGFSVSAADIFGGAVLMTIGSYPYLRRARKP